MEPLSHFDQHGHSRMVDVSAKAVTQREAVARGRVTMQPATFARIVERDVYKGDVLEVARLRALLRRTQEGTSPVLQLADLTLDPASRRVARGGSWNNQPKTSGKES